MSTVTEIGSDDKGDLTYKCNGGIKGDCTLVHKGCTPSDRLAVNTQHAYVRSFKNNILLKHFQWLYLWCFTYTNITIYLGVSAEDHERKLHQVGLSSIKQREVINHTFP